MVKGRHQKGYLNKHIEALDFLTKVEHIHVLNGTSGKKSHVLIKISLLCKKKQLKKFKSSSIHLRKNVLYCFIYNSILNNILTSFMEQLHF